MQRVAITSEFIAKLKMDGAFGDITLHVIEVAVKQQVVHFI